MTQATQERTFFSPLLDAQTNGLEEFRVEEFRPCIGTVLVVTPPPRTKTKGGLTLPESAIGMPTWGVVASVPLDCDCPVNIGDKVVFREGAGTAVAFNDRKDLLLLQYTDEADSEILGRFPVDA